MKINLESNFNLLGSRSINTIHLDVSEITVKDFLEKISERSTKPFEYLNDEGTGVDRSLQLHVNGRMLDLYENGIGTALKDGDTVAILMNVLEGCCGGALQE